MALSTPLLRLVAVTALVVLAGLVVAPHWRPASARELPDPALDQSIDRDQELAEGRVVLGEGHIDIGPRLVDGELTLMVHDGTAGQPVWRDPDQTVLAVTDQAVRTAPDDPTYDFLGVDAGADVHVIPQVQRSGVVWLGWNTQDPALMEYIDRGVTLTLAGVDGPGELTVYLQSGVLGDPEVLWQSAVPQRQSVWVAVNSHTHANWVFTEPGVYLMQLEAVAELIDGRTVSTTGTVRFAVGDATDPVRVFDAELPRGSFSPDPVPDRSDADLAGNEVPVTTNAGTELPLSALVALVVAVAVAAALVVTVRTNRARSRAARQRAADAPDGVS